MSESGLQTICPITEEGEEDEEPTEDEINELDEQDETELYEESSSGDLMVKLVKHRAKMDRERRDREDDGSETDLEVEEERADYDVSGKTTYMNACRTLGAVPVSYFVRHMNDARLSLAHHGLGSQGMRALAYPLMNNTNVLCLDLQDNWLEGEGGEFLAEMLKENCYIVDLNVSNNRLGNLGCDAICKVLQNNTTLKHINLSGNDLADSDSQPIAEMLYENNILKTLNLSNNHFGHTSSMVLSNAISENETIERIDLSWNNFRLKSGFNICQGIATNSRLKVINLAMNGLGNEGAFGVAEMLKLSGTVIEIDISNNRIGLPGATVLGKALEANDLLKVLKIGHNPVGIDGIKLLLAGVCPEASCVKELDLTGIVVDKEFRAMKEQLQETRDIVINHGLVLSDYVIKPKPKKKKSKLFATPLDDLNGSNVMSVMKSFFDENGLDICVILESYDKNKEKKVPWSEFLSAIADAGIQLSTVETEQLENLLEDHKTVDGKVDFSPLK